MRFQSNTIYCGDCEYILQRFPECTVDLVYADPPFFSNRSYEILWDDGYELRAFEDRWKGGLDNYVAWMTDRLRWCYHMLKETGSMYLHCDHHAFHYLKAEMDKIFGERNFRNEIIWKRTSAHSGVSQSRRSFGGVHDTILFYSKSDNYSFYPQYTAYEEKYLEQFYRHYDSNGRRFRLSDLTASGIRHGESGKEWHGIDPSTKGNHWKYTVQKLDELEKAGRIYFAKKAGGYTCI